MAPVVLLLAGLLLAAPAWAEPKTLRVTGLLAEVRDDLIVIEKGKERWEILRTPGTQVKGELKKGSRVTVDIRMSAATVEVREDRKKPASAKP
jgi:hypothetical protein